MQVPGRAGTDVLRTDVAVRGGLQPQQPPCRVSQRQGLDGWLAASGVSPGNLLLRQVPEHVIPSEAILLCDPV